MYYFTDTNRKAYNAIVRRLAELASECAVVAVLEILAARKRGVTRAARKQA